MKVSSRQSVYDTRYDMQRYVVRLKGDKTQPSLTRDITIKR